jgi:lysozyme
MMQELLQDLQRDEDFRNRLYDDSNGQPLTKGSAIYGYPTIGFGCRADLPMPREVAELWLKLAAEERWLALLKQLPWLSTEPDNVQRALGNLVYNAGVQGVMGFTKMLSALQSGDYETAALELKDSTMARQRPDRAERLSQLIRGDYGNP